jgi:hypothetical protein
MFKNLALMLPCLLLATPGCRSVPTLPPLDFGEAGWKSRRGDALWRPPGSGVELAGEVWVAVHADGRGWAQFVKPPFPVVTARHDAGMWELETGEGRRYARGGEPPERIVWFQVLRACRGEAPRGRWQWRAAEDEPWRLEGPRGEWLEVHWRE